MSVAFRRDSDEEHLEPQFEIPLPAGPNLVTPRGLRLIHDKLGELEQQLSGISDEAEIKKHRRVIRYWSTRQSTAEVMPRPDGGSVAFGTKVTIELNGKQRVLALVGDDEADPSRGLLSFSAPISRAIMRAEPGDFVDFNGEEEAIEIVAIGVLTEAF